MKDQWQICLTLVTLSLAPRISACFTSTKMISRIRKCDHAKLASTEVLGSPAFFLKPQNLWFSLVPVRTTNCWKADASSSLYKKCGEESTHKVTFRLWGFPMPKLSDWMWGGGDPSNYLNVKQLNIWKTKSLNDLKNFLHACVFMFGKRLERENKKSIKPFFLSFKIC